MRTLGQREIRMGPTSLGGNVLRNYSLQVDMTVCDHCHK